MISWTIPADKTTTGYTVFTSSQSGSTSDSGIGAGGVTATIIVQSSSSYFESRYTSAGTSATTAYTSTFSDSFTSSERTFVTFSGTNSGVTNSSQSNRTIAETTNSATTPLPSAFIQTSTTTSFEVPVFSTETYPDTSEVWTTSSNTEESSVEFFLTEAETTLTYEEFASNVAITQEAVTLLNQTQAFGERATVVQANTIRAANADVLYVCDPPNFWNGFSVASESATSGTRITILPSYSTEESPVVDGTMTPTSSLQNPVVSSTISWSASRTTQSARIMPLGNFTGVNVVVLPISTSETIGAGTTTTQSQASFTVFSANTLNYNITNSARSGVTTTSAVTSWGNSRVVVPRRFGNILFETTQTLAVSTERTITTLVAASASGSSSGSVNLGGGNPAYNQTTASGSAISANFNFNVYGEPQATTAAPAPGFTRSKFITTGAVIGTNRGGWFTANGSFFLPIAHDGNGRRGVTIFPTEFPFVTAYSDSVTFTVLDGTETKTSSAVIGVEGQSFTIQNASQSFAGDVLRPNIQGAASALPEGMTIVDVCREAGAYKNAIGGETSSFSAGMTSYSEGESALLSCWQAVTAIAPPVLRLERSPIYWTAPRNPSGLPPGAP